MADTPLFSEDELNAMPEAPAAPAQPLAPAPKASEAFVKNETSDPKFNNMRYMTRIILPDGTTGKARPEDLDALVLRGARTFNPNMEVEVKLDPFSSEGFKVKGSELEDYLKKGYTTQRGEQYIREEQAFQQQRRTELDNIGLSAPEYALGLASSAASGITMGASDIATRGLFELKDLIAGTDTAEANAKEVGELRSKMGWIDTAAQAAGAIGTGIATGGLSALGGTAARRIGLGALEGILGGAGMTAGQQALGDESINAEAYLMNMGLGGAIGGLGGGLVEGLGKVVGRVKTTAPVKAIDVNFGDLTDIKSATSLSQTLPIMSEGKLLGTMNVSRGVSGYHPGINGTGIVLEGVDLAADAPKGTLMNAMRQLTDEFGMVSSPSTVEALAPLKKDFALMGVKKSTQMGDDWFMITQSTFPAEVKESQAVLKMSKILQTSGDTPEEKALIQKLYSPEASGLRKEFANYAEDPDAAISAVMKHFKELSDVSSATVKAMTAVQDEVASKVTAAGAIRMKNAAIDKWFAMEDKLSRLKRSGSDTDALAASKIEKLGENLNVIISESDPREAWRKMLQAKREFFNDMKSYNKQDVNKVIDPDTRDFMSKVYSGLKETLEAEDVVGKDAMEMLLDLDKKSANSVQASNNFKQKFYSKDANEQWFLDNNKVKSAFKSNLDEDRRLTVIDSIASDFSAFHDSVSKAQKAGFIQGVALPDLKQVLPSLSEINKYREFADLVDIMKKKSGVMGVTKMLEPLSAIAGLTGAGIPGFFIARGAARVSEGIIQNAVGAALGNPAAGIRLAQRSTSTIDSIVNLGAAAISSSTKTAVPISRVELIRSLGAKKTEANDHDGYIESVRQRLIDLSHPEALAQAHGTITNPAQEQAIVDAAGKAFTYALSKLPKVNTYSKTSSIAAKKVDKLILATVQPIKALEKAIHENDTDTIEHVQNMYPKMYEIFQASVSRQLETAPKLSYQKRMHIQRLTGIPYRGTSAKASDIAQGVFAAMAEEGGSKPGPKKKSNVTAPSMPAGAAIQD